MLPATPASLRRAGRALWFRPQGTHTCLLAAVIARADHPLAGGHVWEHNNLAQKNLTVVDLLPNTFFILPVVVSNWYARFKRDFGLEVIRGRESAGFEASLIHPTPEIFGGAKATPKPFTPFTHRPVLAPEQVVLECGAHIAGSGHARRGRLLTSTSLDLIQDRYPKSWEVAFPAKGAAKLALDLPPFNQTEVGLKIAVPANAKPGEVIRLHFVQRSLSAKRIVGGVAVLINVRKPGELRTKQREKTE